MRAELISRTKSSARNDIEISADHLRSLNGDWDSYIWLTLTDEERTLQFGARVAIQNEENIVKFKVHIGHATAALNQVIKVAPSQQILKTLLIPVHVVGTKRMADIKLFKRSEVVEWKLIRLECIDGLPEFSLRPSDLFIATQLEDIIIYDGQLISLKLRDGTVRRFACRVDPESKNGLGVICKGKTRIQFVSPTVSSISATSRIPTLYKDLEEHLRVLLFFNANSNLINGLPIPQKLLLHGPSGVGKTTLICEAAKLEGYSIIKVDSSTWQRRVEIEASPSLSFLQEALAATPSILLFEEISMIVCTDEIGDTEWQQRANREWYQLIRKIEPNHKIVVIATTSNIRDVDQTTRNEFHKEIRVDAPTQEGREMLLQHLLPYLKSNEIQSLASELHGYTPSDLQALIRAAHSLVSHSPSVENVSSEQLQVAKRQIRSASIERYSPVVPQVRWEDIGGLRHVKEKLRQATIWIYERSEVFSRMGITPPRGILLSGPPGTGKTLSVKAVATESKANFIYVSIADVVKAEVGESEKAISEIFRIARRNSPCIIFFDEMQAMFGTRDTAAHHGKNMIAQLMLEMDGIESSPGVIVVAATNRIDLIDESFLRPGRFDYIIEVSLPDEIERRDILLRHLQRANTTLSAKSDAFVWKLAKATKGFSGADLRNILTRASILALMRDPPCEVLDETILMEALKELQAKSDY